MLYTFGACRLDTASRDFSRNGKSIHLSPKAFDLFCLLITQRPRVVSKAELMSALWPDTFVVEANLPVIVGELRAALGDTAASTSAIKTHHGIGYSFVAEALESRSAGDDVDAPRAGLKVGKRRVLLTAGTHTIGRDRNSDVHLDDASVSRCHARIMVAEDGVWLEDLKSKNGTFVKRTRLSKPMQLLDGDEVTFGIVRTSFFEMRREDRSTLSL